MSSTISIVETGATPNTKCTEAIQSAIDKVAEAGGGTVLIPDGLWLSGTLVLKTGVTLHINPNATLKSTGDMADHPAMESFVPKGPKVVDGGRGGPLGDLTKHHFIHAAGAENITITGGGTLDGNGPAFWDMDNIRGDGWIPANPKRVSPMIDFRGCKRVVMDNVRVVDSPGWTIHPYDCDDVVIHNVRVENNLFGPNTDGIDVNGCRDVFISDCKLVCGDDCIIIKATTGNRSTERVLVTNCVVKTNCIGVGIGQETEAGIRDITVSNCVMTNCHRMFAIGLWNGGWVENVTVTGCVGDTLENFPLARPIHIDVKRHAAREEAGLGVLRNVSISNFVSRTAGRVMITGEREGTIQNLVIRDLMLDVTTVEDAMTLSPPDGVTGSSQYSNRNLEARKQHAAVIVENVENCVLDGLMIRWPEAGAGAVDLPYAALWARGIRGGRIDAALLEAYGETDAMLLDDIDVRLFD